MPYGEEAAPPRAASYSACLSRAITGAPLRGVVHSAFAAAANILFPGDVVVSLNADAPDTQAGTIAPFPGMPNGIQVAGFPFAVLRPGMPVLLGAGRLIIDAIDCALDLTCCSQWNVRIERPDSLDAAIVNKNAAWLARCYPTDSECERFRTVQEIAWHLCGRGPGLTPSGDDMLLGWMAANWLLYGPRPQVIADCQEIVAVARQRTHLLSQTWLAYAAQGCVALPILILLTAMTREDTNALAAAADIVSSMGATSGRDVIRGIVMGITQQTAQS